MFLYNVIFHFYEGGGVSDSHVQEQILPIGLVPAKGMSRSAGHCFLSNVKLHFLYNGFFVNKWGRGKTQIDDCHNKMVIIFEGFP